VTCWQDGAHIIEPQAGRHCDSLTPDYHCARVPLGRGGSLRTVGLPGKQGVNWGDLAHFNAYVAKLNWFLPAAVVPGVGWAATGAETLLALGLLIGCYLRWVSLASTLLLLSFAITMLVAPGPKAPLDYSVFTSACATFLLFESKQSAKTPNQSMKPTAPLRYGFSVFATTLCRGLSLSR